jgi:hypothetical protein
MRSMCRVCSGLTCGPRTVDGERKGLRRSEGESSFQARVDHDPRARDGDRSCTRCRAEDEMGRARSVYRERARLTEEQVAATCAADVAASTYSPRERLLLRMMDELRDTAR